MKIRDIQDFRLFYKTGVRKTWDRNRDENFIGSSVSSNGRTQFGFFDIYHGDKAEKEGIEGFLRGFLDMAQDSQAIYEFLQNAVDANSTTFEMYYDDEYFLAFNNGSQFSFEGIRSILNVGVSTKSQDSSNIGKFGIGFKLIHRLVGEKSGLEELKNLSGPVLFSWGNAEQLKELQNFTQNSNLTFEQDEYFHIKNSNGKFGNTKNLPWLFKILLTNFPCQPEETIKNLNYQETTNAFSMEEVVELAHWAKTKIKVDTLKHSLNSGSLFFLRLGKDKVSKLSNKRIEDGIQFSLSILNHIAYYQKKQGKGISQIRVNENVFEAKRLFFERFVIKFGSEEYNQIKPQRRSEEDTSDIEVLVGFMDYKIALKEIKGNPNFYLFFPLSEEVHNLSLIIHSTGFYNASQRTNLQGNENTNPETRGINEALLGVIAENIKQKLLSYFKDTAKDEMFRYRFLKIYSNLLLSDKATENHKNWVDACFIEPIFDILKTKIPTQNGYSDTPENVKIKATHLPIQPSYFGCPDIEWFAWQNEKTDKVLIDEARNSEKLHLEKWDIVDLLKYAISKGKIEIINEWVKQANEKHFADANNKDYTYLSFVQEIDKNILERDLPIISQIKLFKFSDGDYYSLNEIFSNSNLVLIYDKLAKIKQELRLLGFIFSDLNISYKREGADNPLYSSLLKLVLPKINEETLFTAIAEKCKGNNLYHKQKHNLFFVLAEFKGIGIETLKDLELFRDTQGNIRSLRTLLKGTLQVPTWLSFFKISLNEYIAKLDAYIVKDKEIYQAIIYKNWDFLVGQNPNIKDFYGQVTAYYKQNLDNPRLEKLACIFTNEGFKKPEQVFFNLNLNSYNFDELQTAIFKITNKPTPNKLIFSFLTDDNSPFKISRNDTIGDFITANYSLLHNETLAILEFAKNNNEKLFSIAYIQKQNDTFLLVKHSQSVFQYHSNRQEINELLSNQPNFKLLPKEFNANDFGELGIWQDKGLYIKILQVLDFSENLLPIVRESDKEVQLAYLEKLKDFSLQEGKVYDRNSFEHHCLKLAIDCYADDFQTKFAPKILINGKLRIKDIAVKDDMNFENITLYLSSVLPDYKGFSDIITKIIDQFVEFTDTELSEKVFPINNKKKDEVYSELVTKFPTLQNIEQFAFLLYYSKQSGKNFFTNQLLTALPNVDILQFAYKQKFTELANFLNTGLKDKIYSSELALEPEKLPTWVLTWLESEDKQEKLNFLSALGVHTENSNICTIRRFFQTGQNIDVQACVVALSQGLLLNTLKWLQDNTFNTSESTKLDALKQIYSRINYTQDIPLLYVSQITDGETLYNLEVSTAIKYYFEAPQKEYSQKIFTVLQSKGFKLIALDYCKHWQTRIKPEKIATTEVLDIEKIKQNCKAWNDSAYNSWEAKSKYPIFIYEGDKIPYKTIFHGTDIDTFEKERSKKDGNVIYVSKSVSDIKQELLNEKLVLTDDLLKLYSLNQSNSNEVISVIQEYNLTVAEIQDLIRIKEWFFNRSRPTLEPKTDAEIKAISNISSTGVKGEDIVNQYLISKFGTDRVIWASQKGEARYDFEVLTSDKTTVEMYIDAKATITSEYEADKIPILIRTRAWDFLKANKYGNFFIARIFDVNNAKVEDVKLLEIRWRDL